MQGQPIPFIELNEVEKDGEYVTIFTVNPQAIKILSEQSDKRVGFHIYAKQQVAVLVIAGPQRTGKSFLANRVLKRQSGFAIGPTTNPCTKGIWLWSQPIQLDAQTNLILLDTEGLNSVCKKIFNIKKNVIQQQIQNYSLQLYYSHRCSCSIRHIDEQSIENLSLVINISENVSVGGQSTDNKNLSQFFPNFLWVLRDFSLDLKGRSSNEYLEFALQNQPGNGIELAKKNQIRSKIREFFKQRECLCLVRPLNDEHLLARIEEQDFNSLRPEFLTGVQEFELKIKNIQPKVINGTHITGEMFLKLTLEYIDAINSGGIPQILTSLDRVIQQEARKLLEDLKNLYMSRVQKNLYLEMQDLLQQKGKGPFEDEELQIAFRLTSQYVNEKLDLKGRDLVDTSKIIVMKKDINEMMDKDFQQRIDLNKEQSNSICNQLLTRFFNSFQLPILENVESIKETLLREKFSEYGRFFQYYISNAKGVSKFRFVAEKMPSFLFGFFEKLLQSVQKVYVEDHNNTKKYLVQAREGEERLRNTLKDYESLLYEVQKEKESQKYEVENLQRELQKIQKIKELEQNSINSKTDQLQSGLQSKKVKCSKLKNENQELVEQIQRLRNELNAKRIECAGLLKRFQDDGGRSFVRPNDAHSDQMYSGDKIEDLTNDIMVQYKDMKHQAAVMNEFFKRRALDQTQQNIFIQEIQKLQQDKFNEIQRIKEDFKQKKLKLRDDLERDKKSLKSSLDHIVKQNEDLKAQNMTFFEKAESIERKEQQIKSLFQENQKLNQALNSKCSNLETHMQVIDNFTKDIMKLTGMREDLEQKLAFLNSEKSNLISFKESFPYILKESLKWVLNKNSKLKHAIKAIGEDDQQSIKECFQEVGINL